MQSKRCRVTSHSPTRFDVFLSVGTLKTGVLRRSAFREANLESPDATLPSLPGQGVSSKDAVELRSVTDFMACCSEKKRVRLVEENIPV